MAKPPARSRYDELHDKYHRIATTKAGTRYERLAALVFKALEAQHAVIHDLKLTGEDPEVLHQIDVTVEIGDSSKRLIIECKDFDISGAKVGLDIVRNFRSVVEDTKAEEAIVISCNGFTEDAQKYARSKNIKLAVLRVFEESDQDGRIKRIIVGLTVAEPKNPRVMPHLHEPEGHRLKTELAKIGLTLGIQIDDPVYVTRGNEKQHINTYLTAHMNDAMHPGGPKALRIAIPADGWQIQVDGNTPIPFQGVVIEFEVDEESVTFDVVSQRVAELILSGFGSGDVIIFGDQIERLVVDPETGQVSSQITK